MRKKYARRPTQTYLNYDLNLLIRKVFIRLYKSFDSIGRLSLPNNEVVFRLWQFIYHLSFVFDHICNITIQVGVRIIIPANLSNDILRKQSGM